MFNAKQEIVARISSRSTLPNLFPFTSEIWIIILLNGDREDDETMYAWDTMN